MMGTKRDARAGYEYFKANSKVVNGARVFVYDDSESEEVREEKRMLDESLTELYKQGMEREQR